MALITEFLLTLPDPEYQSIIEELTTKNFPSHNLKAVRMSNKNTAKVGPAASLGLYFNGPIGFVFLADELTKVFNSLELRFIIGHEISHIHNSHIISRAVVSIFETILVDMFSRKLVNLFKGLYYAGGQPVLDHKVLRENEMEADIAATNMVSSKSVGINVLEKLAQIYANGNLDAPSHFASLGKIPLPIVTYRERIENLRLSN